MEPCLLLFTDPHLKTENLEEIESLIVQLCEKAVEFDLDRVYCLGDVFESRISQRLDVLDSFDRVLQIFEKYQVTLVVFPGNHDKTNYKSERSFLHQFRHFPYFELISDYEVDCYVEKNVEINIHLLPFFSDEIYREKLLSAEPSGDCLNILLSHQAVTGSINNDGSKVESCLTSKDFEKFDKVFLGHYHNTQEVTSSIIHIPSLKQNNYGENNNKGFVAVYEDLSYEIIKPKFKEYIKVLINLDEITKEEISDIEQTYSNLPDFVRFEFKGDKSKLSSIDKGYYASLGIDVSTKETVIETSIDFVKDEVIVYNKSSIEKEFKEFCLKEGKKYREGLPYLKKKLGHE